VWRCERCGEIFDEPEYVEECAESYYGVSSLFGNYNYISFAICPECGSEKLNEHYYPEEEE